MRYVMVDLSTNLVVNWIDDTDDITQFSPGENCIFVQTDVGVLGDLYIDGVFSKPPPPILTAEEILSINKARQRNWTYVPASVLFPLFLAVDLDSESNDPWIKKAIEWQSWMQEMMELDLTIQDVPIPNPPSEVWG